MKNKIDVSTFSRAEWLQLRRSGVGTSEVAAILNADPYKSAVDLYLSKINGEEIADSHLMRYGRDIEPIIASWFSEDTGFEVVNDSFMIYDDVEPRLFTNLDRKIHFEGNYYPLELKSTSENLWKIRQEETNADEDQPQPFLNHFIQVQGQLACTNSDWAFIAYEISGYYGKELKYIKIERNEKVINTIREAVRNFWNQIETKTPPKPESKIDLEKLIVPAKGKEIEATESVLNWVTDLKRLNDKKKEIDSKIEELKTTIALYMDDAEALTHNGVKLISYKQTERAGYEVKPTIYRALKPNYNKIDAEEFAV